MAIVLGSAAAAAADDRIHLIVDNQASDTLTVESSSAHAIPAPDQPIPAGAYFENNDCDAPLVPNEIPAQDTGVDVCSTLIDAGSGAEIGLWTVQGTYGSYSGVLFVAQILDPAIGPLTCQTCVPPIALSDDGSGEYDLTLTWTDASAQAVLTPDASASGAALGAAVGSAGT